MWVNATVSNGSWTVTGASLPTFPSSVSGLTYYIFAQAIDGANNLTPQPGSPTLPQTSQTSYIQVVLQTPPPQSTITSPVSGIPNLKPNAITLQGTAINATTDQVQIIDCGADFTLRERNDDLYWTGSVWASTTSAGFLTNSGFIGVTAYSTTTLVWTMNFTSGNWNANHKYNITSKAKNVPQSLTQTTNIQTVSFIIDSSAPVTSIVLPPAQTYISTLSVLAANITDAPAGQVSSTAGDVYFTAKQQGSSNFWDWTLSTFTASGSNTQLVAATTGSYNNGYWTYSTTTFQTGGTWMDGGQYEVQIFAKDKAGNQNISTVWDFTYDVTKPTATIVVPQIWTDGGQQPHHRFRDGRR